MVGGAVAMLGMLDYVRRGAGLYLIVAVFCLMPFVWAANCAFLIVANNAFRQSALGESSSSAREALVSLRGVHLGLNLSGLVFFGFPIFTLIGVPLVIGRLFSNRSQISGNLCTISVVGAGSIITLITAIAVAGVLAATRDFNPMFGQGHGLFGQPGGLLINTAAGTTCVVLLALLHVVVHISFIVLADRVILRALSQPHDSKIVTTQVETEEEFDNDDGFITANDED